MYFRTEHTGIINESSTISFEIPRYTGCITLQIYTYAFDGTISATYSDPAGIERNCDNIEFVQLNRLLQFNTNNKSKIEPYSHILSLNILASKLNLNFLFNSETDKSSIDKIIVLA